MRHIDIIIGTRPDAIKMLPLIQRLGPKKHLKIRIVSTGQHRDLLPLVLAGLKVDIDLAVMRTEQVLSHLIGRIFAAYTAVLEQQCPDAVLVHGDTATAFAAALAAFYQQVKIFHVEAGLRSNELYSPFPEEGHRRMIAQMAALHFAPDGIAHDRLLAEGIAKDQVFVTGNTIANAIYDALNPQTESAGQRLSKNIELLFTIHRSEKNPTRLQNIFKQLLVVAEEFPQLNINYVLHPRPGIQPLAMEIFGSHRRIKLFAPMEHTAFIKMMFNCDIVLTDSGGVQEEGVALGKKVLILRDRTERHDGLATGQAQLIDPSFLRDEISHHLRLFTQREKGYSIPIMNPAALITELVSGFCGGET